MPAGPRYRLSVHIFPPADYRSGTVCAIRYRAVWGPGVWDLVGKGGREPAVWARMSEGGECLQTHQPFGYASYSSCCCHLSAWYYSGSSAVIFALPVRNCMHDNS